MNRPSRRMAQSSRREYWRKLLERQAASGLSVKAFCLREKVPYSTFFVWKRRLPDEPIPAKDKIAFAPVTVVASLPSMNGNIEIVLSGERRVVVHGSVDRQSLTDVLAVLGVCGGAGGGGGAC